MADGIWSGKEHFLKGHAPKKKSIRLPKMTPIQMIATAAIIILFISFIYISYYRYEEEPAQTTGEIVYEDDLGDYRDMDAEDLLKMLNEKRGFKEEHPLKEFYITAKKYSFEPNKIKVDYNDKVRLNLKSVDIDHNIRIPAFFVSKKIPAAEDTLVEFTANKEGEFRFYSKDNENMAGTIIVTKE